MRPLSGDRLPPKPLPEERKAPPGERKPAQGERKESDRKPSERQTSPSERLKANAPEGKPLPDSKVELPKADWTWDEYAEKAKAISKVAPKGLYGSADIWAPTGTRAL